MIELPLTAGRTLLRGFRPGDAAVFAAYRSDPEVARYQSWDAPFPLERAVEHLAAQAHLSGPTPGEWVQVAVEHEGAVIGDVAVLVDADGATAEIGFTLDPRWQGRGLALDATGALVDALLQAGLHRLTASVDPANHASRRLLERLGFVLEGTARQAFAGRTGFEDDERWALLAEDRRSVVERPGPPADVRLVELGGRQRKFGALEVHPTQRHLVASVWESYADALFPEQDDGGGTLRAWLRGVEADGVPAGFVMLAEATPTFPLPMLWRLLVDRRHQARGIGARVVAQVADRCRSAGHPALLTSWVPERGGPEPFYRALGFVPTGEVEDGEVVARLDL